MQQLRESTQFEALPPVDALALVGAAASHRYVRQDDPLWRQLHEGVLTTGLVRSALGLYEKSSTKKVGIPNSRAGHRELLQAYHHLRSSIESSSSSGGSGSSGSDGDGGTGDAAAAAAAAAAAHNAAAVLAYNAGKSAGAAVHSRGAAGEAVAHGPAARSQDVAQDSAGDVAPAPAAAAAGKSKHAKRRLRKKQAAVAPAAEAVPSEDAGGFSEEQKQRKARALGSQGLLSICCSWGCVQEAAALRQVAAAFSGSQLAEVGLCRLQPELLPASWGWSPGSLPPIGASPDALIRHRPAPAAAATGGTPAAAHGGANGGTAAAAAAGVGVVGSAAGGGVNGSGVDGGASPLAAGTVVQTPGVEPWDVDALLARLQLAGADAGAASASSGSSGDGMTGNSSGSSSGSVGGRGGASQRGLPSSGGGGDDGCLVEVVEVKNTCPFGHSRRNGRLRTSEFMLADKGPRQAVPPEWVPQLQLHMLCAGTPSGLLVSRSATKGTRVFRMSRDDELLRLMLAVLSRLWREHVLVGRPPPPDAFASWHVHHDMLRRIQQAARGAVLVKVVPEGEHLPDGDHRWFLD